MWYYSCMRSNLLGPSRRPRAGRAIEGGKSPSSRSAWVSNISSSSAFGVCCDHAGVSHFDFNFEFLAQIKCRHGWWLSIVRVLMATKGLFVFCESAQFFDSCGSENIVCTGDPRCGDQADISNK